jgi:hypothetical protein
MGLLAVEATNTTKKKDHERRSELAQDLLESKAVFLQTREYVGKNLRSAGFLASVVGGLSI